MAGMVAGMSFPTLNKYLEDKEYEYMEQLLTLVEGNIRRAAELAGRSLEKFYKGKVLAYGFRAKDFRRVKVMEKKVQAIRADGGLHSYRELAKMHGVSSSTVRDIVIRRTWKHL
jgi:hypothetical protein